MTNYSNGKIYCITCYETGEVYYGSTTQTVAKRIGKHRKGFRENQKGYVSPGKNTPTYMSSFQILERNNYGYSLVENYPCDSKEQLHAREGWYILNNDCINKRVEGRSWDKERKKVYREENKEEIKERKKEYYERNKEKINEKSKAYREKNKEQIKAYREQTKDEINRKVRETKCICPHCLTWMLRKSYNRHTRSKTCIKNAEYSQSNMID